MFSPCQKKNYYGGTISQLFFFLFCKKQHSEKGLLVFTIKHVKCHYCIKYDPNELYNRLIIIETENSFKSN